jgi:nucleolar MIF4G domain-containing protein 1
VDAFEKLSKLNLKGKQDREVANVLVHCVCMEKTFNKYYLVLAHRLCSQNYNFKFSFQYLLWDKLKDLSASSPLQISLLAKFYAGLFGTFSLSLGILKVLDFASLTAHQIVFLRVVFVTIFCDNDAETVTSIMQRLGHAFATKTDSETIEKGEMLIQGIRFFLVSCVKTLLNDDPPKDLISNPVLCKKNLKVALSVLKELSTTSI